MAGPPPQEQIDATLAWVQERFRHHYTTSPPDLPPRFTKREFGFLWNGKKFFLRHTGFSSKQAFHDFLIREAPSHAYYSTAYYQTPHAATMAEKNWLGADLIFDLDADHLPGGDKMSFADQLSEVKKQARKLLHEYLLGDFGFSPDNIRIVFSGGRGYHFHVNDPRVLQMQSAERREIVDYVSPNDMVAASLFDGWVHEVGRKKDDFGRVKRSKTAPPASAPGWDGRITRTVADFLDDLCDMDPQQAIRDLAQLPGVGRKTATEISAKLTREKVARIRDEGKLEQFSALAREPVIQGLIAKAKVAAPGETDEPVTADIKRLIRLPGSLHGKTGLRVVPLTLEAFETFDPLRDAVAFDDTPARIVVSKPIDVPLAGKDLHLEPGEQDVPEYAAVFALLRRSALMPWTA